MPKIVEIIKSKMFLTNPQCLDANTQHSAKFELEVFLLILEMSNAWSEKSHDEHTKLAIVGWNNKCGSSQIQHFELTLAFSIFNEFRGILGELEPLQYLSF